MTEMQISCSIATYTVKEGDSLSTIAKKHSKEGVNVQQIKQVNPEIKGPKFTIKPGQQIVLPFVKCKMGNKNIPVGNPKETFRILYDLHKMAQKIKKEHPVPKYETTIKAKLKTP